MEKVINIQKFIDKISHYRNCLLVIVFVCIVSGIFFQSLTDSLPLIFKKDLYHHDESSNSVVTANITRKFFPPMVRVNPLVTEQGNWMEGPYWQHIPPIFAYVPYLGYLLDGQISIEVKRLSFALLQLLTAWVFIVGIFWVTKNIYSSLAAAIATGFWLNNYFSRDLINGTAFGVSDIVLAMFAVLAFLAVSKYLYLEKDQRLDWPMWKLISIMLVTVLPFLAKNLLGLIPAAMFIIILFFDYGFKHKKFIYPVLSGLALAIGYNLIFFLVSPTTYVLEIGTALNHLTEYEGWGRPWHYYLTNYFPKNYFQSYNVVFWVVLFVTVISAFFKPVRIKKLAFLALIYFFWNLIAVSIISSKTPNFIYQSLLLVFFFIALIGFEPFSRRFIFNFSNKILIIVLIGSLSFVLFFATSFSVAAVDQRRASYAYGSEHELFYLLAEQLRDKGASQNDLIIFDLPPNDCWARYYTLFLIGAESKTALELFFNFDLAAAAKNYKNIYYITPDNSKVGLSGDSQEFFSNFIITKFAVNDSTLLTLNDYIQSQPSRHWKEIQRIKKDKTSCQWLVPDLILNAR